MPEESKFIEICYQGDEEMQLNYFLVSAPGNRLVDREQWGIGVRLQHGELAEEKIVWDISTRKDDVEKLLDIVRNALVTPCTLLDVVCDALGA